MSNFAKILESLMNNDEATASQLFHEFVVESSRVIYEKIELLENRIDFLKNNLRDKIDTSHDTHARALDSDAIVDYFADVDPTRNKLFLQWILKQYQQKKFRQEDAPRIQQALANFERYKGKLPNKDINAYKSLSDVESAVEPMLGQAASGKEQARQTKAEGAELLLDKNGVKVIRLKSEEAACHYGKGTKWCTAADKNNMFNEYNEDGPIYYIEARDESGKKAKYQYHPASDQFMDAQDDDIDISDFIKRNPEVLETPGLEMLRDYPDNVPPEVLLARAMSNHDPNVRFPAASNPNMTPKLLERALRDWVYQIREAAAGNPNMTPELLAQALKEDNWRVRRAAAGNPNMTPELLAQALNDEDLLIRQAAARNPLAQEYGLI